MKIYFDATDIAHWAGHSDRVTGEMIRLVDYDAPAPKHWQTRDRFQITLRP